MHKMMQLRDNLMDELEKFADKPITEQNLEYIDKLAHAITGVEVRLSSFVNGEPSVDVEIWLVETEDGWRIDSPTY